MEPEELEIVKFQVLLAMKKMSEWERLEFFLQIKEHYCNHCGGQKKNDYYATGRCHCTNDE